MAKRHASDWREDVAMWGTAIASGVLGFSLAVYLHENAPEWELVAIFATLALAGLLGLMAWRVRRMRAVAGLSAFFFLLVSMIGTIVHGWGEAVKAIYGLAALVLTVVVFALLIRLARAQSRLWHAVLEPAEGPVPALSYWPSEAALLATAQAPITLYPRRSKVGLYLGRQLVLLLLMAGFFAGSVLLTRDGGPIVAGVLGMALFGLGLLLIGGVLLPMIVYRLVTHRPAVILTQLGIIDHASAIATGVGSVPWEEVAASLIYETPRRLVILKDRYLVVIPLHPGPLTSRVSWRRAILLRLTAQIPSTVLPASLATIHIPEWLLPMSLEELSNQIARFVPRESSDTTDTTETIGDKPQQPGDGALS